MRRPRGPVPAARRPRDPLSTDVRRWAATPRAWLVVAAVLLAATSAGAQEAGANQRLTGEDYYRKYACGVCHGQDRSGTKHAPPLVSLGSYWSVDGLVSYFRLPKPFVESEPRLRELDACYPALSMPCYDRPEENLRKIAEWLLAQPTE